MYFLAAELIENIHKFVDLFITVIICNGIGYAALHVGSDDLFVGPVQYSFSGHDLMGDLHTVAIFFDHFQNAIDLSAGGFQQAADLGFICHHEHSSSLRWQIGTHLVNIFTIYNYTQFILVLQGQEKDIKLIWFITGILLTLNVFHDIIFKII